MSADQGIALARFDGAMPLELVRPVAEAFGAHLAGSRALAGVADYRDANLAPPSARVRAQLRTAAQMARTAHIPTALVVRADELQVWRQHAERLTLAGLPRAAFSDPDRARQWAAEMAALYAAQASFRRERG